MPTDASAGVTRLTPQRWRLRFAVILCGFLAVCIIGGSVILTHRSGLYLLFLILLLPLVIIVALSWFLARSLVIVPGKELAYRNLLGVRRRIPATSTTEVLWYANVAGSRGLPFRKLGTPIGIIDERWAVIRSGGVVVLRLSMWFWSQADLAEIATSLPATLKIHNESIKPETLAKRHRDYYTWIERHYVIYYVIFFLSLCLFALAIFSGLLLLGAGIAGKL